uniref:FERM C-terminal PH-like domain-containing protein n=1 Tax=Astyanax mexicanus TaxID=7994 RepID=A0A8B9L587_ASTMX
MSVLAKQERTVCVLLPTKETLDISVGLKATGQDVFSRVSELLGVKQLHYFGLTVVKGKYPPDSTRGSVQIITDRFPRQGLTKELKLSNTSVAIIGLISAPRYMSHWADFILQIVAKRGVDYLLCHGPKVHRELWGMPCRDAVLLFIRESCRLEDVPVTFYRLHKDKREEKGSALLGLTLRGMQVYQEMNNVRELLYDFPWTNVGRLTFLGKKFEIQPDGLPSARKLVYYTGSAFRSRHLLLHLSSRHRLYLTLQPALTHLRQLEQDEGKHVCVIESISPNPNYKVYYCIVFKFFTDFQQHVNGPGEVSVDDPEETLRLAELLQGVSVDCPSLSSEINSAGEKNLLMGKKLTIILLFFTLQVLKWKTRGSSERHSHSLDDVRLMPRPLLLSTLPNTSRSYTFGLGTGADPQKPTFYGRRSTNCLALDLLEDEQFLELVL